MCLNFIILCILLVNQVFGLPFSTTYQSLKIKSEKKCPSLHRSILSENEALKKCDSVDSKLLDENALSRKNEDAVLCHVYLSVFDHLCENVGNTNYEGADLSKVISQNLKESNIDQVCSSLGNITDSVLKYKFITSALHSASKCDLLCNDYNEVKEVCSLVTFMWMFSTVFDAQKHQKKPPLLQTQKSGVGETQENSNDKLKPPLDLQPPINKNIDMNENQGKDKTLDKSEHKSELPSKKASPVDPDSKIFTKPDDLSQNKDHAANASPSDIANKLENDNTLNKGNGTNLSPNTVSNDKKDVSETAPNSPPESIKNVEDLITKQSSLNPMKTTQQIPSEGSLSRPGSVPEIELIKNQQIKQATTDLDKSKKELNIDNKKEESKPPMQNNESKDIKGQVKGEEVQKENDNKDQVDEPAAKNDPNYDDGDDLEIENEDPEKQDDDKEKDNKKKIGLIDQNIYGKEPPPKPSEVKQKIAEVAKPRETDEDSLNLAANFQNQNIDDSNSYFFSYFMMVCVMFICGYVAYHNKQKILALVLEGRKNRRPSRSRRPNSANYRKLDTTLEEAVTSSCNKNTTQVIY